jgi:hypothetical protein
MWYSFKGAYPINVVNEDPASLLSKGYILVPNKPDVNTTTQIVEWDPTAMNWSVRNINESDLVMPWYIVRQKRDTLLKESDVLVLKHAENNEAVPIELREYRSKLRNIPQEYTNPLLVEWPIKP